MKDLLPNTTSDIIHNNWNIGYVCELDFGWEGFGGFAVYSIFLKKLKEQHDT